MLPPIINFKQTQFTPPRAGIQIPILSTTRSARDHPQISLPSGCHPHEAQTLDP